MAITVANAPISWGIHSAADTRYTYGEVLDQMAHTGYAGLELGPWGFLPTDPATLRAELDARGLALCGATVPVALADPAAHIQGEILALTAGRLVATLGGQHLVLMEDSSAQPDLLARAGRVRAPRLSEAEWVRFAGGVRHIAQAVRDELGLRVSFKNHCGTHVETAQETALLLAHLPADLVGLCLDTGHWHYAGGDAVDALKEHGSRLWHLHFTDCDPNIHQFALENRLNLYEATQAGVFSDLGEGMVDFPRLITMLRRLRYEGWVVVEQETLLDEPDADRQSAQHNRDYLRRLGV
jgi:inosose dehydratase